jgi:hypothetical protein
MTTEAEPTRPGSFVTSLPPWLLACGMLSVYLLTLNHGVSWGNLRQVVELSAWNWRPNVFAPVTFLMSYRRSQAGHLALERVLTRLALKLDQGSGRAI